MKKVLAITLTALFIGSFSVSYASIDLNDTIEMGIEKCDKCGKENCNSCEAKAEKKECSPEQKKACCAKKHGSEAKSSEKKAEKEEASKK